MPVARATGPKEHVSGHPSSMDVLIATALMSLRTNGCHIFTFVSRIGLVQTFPNDVWEHTGLEQGVRHPLAYVMEACDDIAYSVIDAEDIVKKRYASFSDLIDHLQSSAHSGDGVIDRVVEGALKKNMEFKKEAISSQELNDLSMLMFRVKAISEMVEAATDTFVSHVDDILKNAVRGDFELIRESSTGQLCEALKQFDRRHGFQNREVLRVELEGHNYILNTMDMLWAGIDGAVENPDPFSRYAYGRISENYRRAIGNDPSRKRNGHLLCDVVSGMSEGYLQDIHDELRKLKDGRRC